AGRGGSSSSRAELATPVSDQGRLPRRARRTSQLPRSHDSVSIFPADNRVVACDAHIRWSRGVATAALDRAALVRMESCPTERCSNVYELTVLDVSARGSGS